jgi:hypothetical protein
LSLLGMRRVKELKQWGSPPSQQLVQVSLQYLFILSMRKGKKLKQRGSLPSQQLVQVRLKKSAISASDTDELCPYWGMRKGKKLKQRGSQPSPQLVQVSLQYLFYWACAE